MTFLQLKKYNNIERKEKEKKEIVFQYYTEICIYVGKKVKIIAKYKTAKSNNKYVSLMYCDGCVNLYTFEFTFFKILMHTL